MPGGFAGFPQQMSINNAVQQLWVAGRLLSHPVEHKAVADLIRSIEAKIGWGRK